MFYVLAILCASIHCSKQNEMSDAYDWADDAARCYDLAVETLRDQCLAERLPGETVEPLTKAPLTVPPPLQLPPSQISEPPVPVDKLLLIARLPSPVLINVWPFKLSR